MKWLKNRVGTLLLALLALAGLCLMLYPTASDWWNSSRQTSAVASYSAAVDEADDASLDAIRGDALEYNARLAERVKFSI